MRKGDGHSRLNPTSMYSRTFSTAKSNIKINAREDSLMNGDPVSADGIQTGGVGCSTTESTKEVEVVQSPRICKG